MQTETEATPKQAILTWAEKHGVTMSAQFVPFSQSRNKGEESPSLNWRVTLHKRYSGVHAGMSSSNERLDIPAETRDILTTDYSAGCAHCPAYKRNDFKPGDKKFFTRRAIAHECETGFEAGDVTEGWIGDKKKEGRRVRILPEFDSVLWSLSMDSSVIDAGGFEQWAADLGYDTDSRKAEVIYRECLDIALKLRAALGNEAMRELAEAGQDY